MLNNLAEKKDLTLRNSKGFTLIEIVLVLAIAGLIFVIVFLGVQGAQRSRRDTHRKSDVNRLGAQLEQFASNNNGNYPTTGNWTDSSSTWRTQYVAVGNFADPSTGTYVYVTGLPDCTSAADGTIGYTLAGRTWNMRVCLEQGEYTQTN